MEMEPEEDRRGRERDGDLEQGSRRGRVTVTWASGDRDLHRGLRRDGRNVKRPSLKTKTENCNHEARHGTCRAERLGRETRWAASVLRVQTLSHDARLKGNWGLGDKPGGFCSQKPSYVRSCREMTHRVGNTEFLKNKR